MLLYGVYGVQNGFNVIDINSNSQDLYLMYTEILPLVFE